MEHKTEQLRTPYRMYARCNVCEWHVSVKSSLRGLRYIVTASFEHEAVANGGKHPATPERKETV